MRQPPTVDASRDDDDCEGPTTAAQRKESAAFARVAAARTHPLMPAAHPGASDEQKDGDDVRNFGASKGLPILEATIDDIAGKPEPSRGE